MGLFSFWRKEGRLGASKDKAAERSRQSKPSLRSKTSEADHRLDPLLPEKQRAHRRLVGAVVLMLIAIIVLPLVLDQQPKPAESDLDVHIIHQVPKEPLPLMAKQVVASSLTTQLSTAQELNQDSPSSTKTPNTTHYIVQLGIFEDASHAQYWLNKLKNLNIPAYIEIKKKQDGETTQAFLRAGPFNTRAAAKKAVNQVKQAGLV